MVVPLGRQYHVGEKAIVMTYTYYVADRHAGTPDKTKGLTLVGECAFLKEKSERT